MSHDKHLCPICGKPTSVWYGNARKDGLCREHAQMLKEGKLTLQTKNANAKFKNTQNYRTKDSILV